MRHLGTVQLETERLILRRFRTDDAKDMYAWAGDETVTKYLSWAPHKNIEETKNVLRIWIEDYANDDIYHWGIVPKNIGEVIGTISAMEIKERSQRCEIGYCIAKSYWNNGIMTEALAEVIRFLFEKVGFNRIQAKHQTDNPASGRVMLKAGMIHEGVLRQYHKNNKNEFIDCELYAITKEDYEKLEDSQFKLKASLFC